MNANARNQMVDCLLELASTAFQERVWVRGEGPEVSSYVEVVCQLFDDTGLGDILESGLGSDVFGNEAGSELMRLRTLIDGLPQGLDAPSLLRHPIWKEVVGTAGRAADLVAKGRAVSPRG